MTSKSERPRSRPFYDGKRYVPAESMGYLLYRTMQAMRREADLRMAEHDLTDAQWKPLWKLLMGPATTVLELSREMEMDAGATTRAVDRLVAKGLVERERSETDRRVVHLRLTEAGHATAAQVPHVLASVNNDFLRGFSEAEWQQIKHLLKRMLDNAQALQALHAAQSDPADSKERA